MGLSKHKLADSRAVAEDVFRHADADQRKLLALWSENGRLAPAEFSKLAGGCGAKGASAIRRDETAVRGHI
jgi:hypothetical protein